MEKKHVEPKTHHECKCRECDTITSMAERVDAFQAAVANLQKVGWPDDEKPSVRETMMLADWFYYGSGDGDGD